MKKRNNQMIEAVRYLSCIAILCIHCGLQQPYRQFIYRYGRFAVPFFLLVSGFFTYGDELQSRSAKKLKQTLGLIAIHAPICLLWKCANSYIKTASFTSWASKYFNMIVLKEFVLYNRASFIGTTFYYLFMLVYIYSLCLIVSKLDKNASQHVFYMLPLAVALFAIGYYIDHFMKKSWYYVGNFLFTGIPIFVIGFILRAKQQMITRIKNKEIWLLCLCLLITYGEARFLQGSTYLLIGQVLFAVVLLCFCLNNSRKKAGLLAILGSDCSEFVFIYHCQIRDTVKLVLKQNGVSLALITAILSTVAGLILHSLRHRRAEKLSARAN